MSRDLIGADCKTVELKVISVTEGKLPSLVARKVYEIREGLQPKPVNMDNHGQTIIPVVGVLPVDESGDPPEQNEELQKLIA